MCWSYVLILLLLRIVTTHGLPVFLSCPCLSCPCWLYAASSVVQFPLVSEICSTCPCFVTNGVCPPMCGAKKIRACHLCWAPSPQKVCRSATAEQTHQRVCFAFLFLSLFTHGARQECARAPLLCRVTGSPRMFATEQSSAKNMNTPLVFGCVAGPQKFCR